MPKYAPGAIEAANLQKSNRHAERAANVGNAISAGLASYNQQKESERDQEILAKMENPELSKIGKASLAAKLSARGQQVLKDTLDFEHKFKRDQEIQDRYIQEQQLREAREDRLARQDAQKTLTRIYQNKLNTLRDQIKDTYSEDAKKPLRTEQAALQKELAMNLKSIREGKRPQFQYLDIGETGQEEEAVSSQNAPQMNQMGAGLPNIMPGGNARPSTSQLQNAIQSAGSPLEQASVGIGGATQRQKWNPRDPAHAARAAQIFQETGGDRAQTNQILSQEFQR